MEPMLIINGLKPCPLGSEARDGQRGRRDDDRGGRSTSEGGVSEKKKKKKFGPT
jgi:hypothetical protein